MNKLFWPAEPDHVVIITAEQSFTNAKSSQAISERMHELSQQGVGEGTLMPLLAVPAVETIFSLLAAFELGATAVMLSPREPAEMMKKWIDSLGCAKVHWGAATLLRTSGTTADPKNAVLTIANHQANAHCAAPFVGFDAQSTWLLSLPLWHVSGLGIIFRSLNSGGAIVIPDSQKSIVQTLERFDLTHVSLVATQLFQLLEAQKHERLKKCRAIVLGGSAIPSKLLDTSAQYELPIVQTYGLTETASQIVARRYPRVGGNDGCKRFNALIKIASDNEILVKGDCVFAGYFDGEKLDPMRDEEGFFHTGDLGFFNSAGELQISGRKSNRIISGGENIQAEEIEGCLLLHPSIEQAIVIAKEDAQWGQRPVAFIKVKGGNEVLMRDVYAYMAAHLASFKIPKDFFLWPENVPQNSIKTPRSWFQKILDNGTMTKLS